MFKRFRKTRANKGTDGADQPQAAVGVPDNIEIEIPGNIIAESADGRLYAGISEISEYVFFELIVLCNQKIKTFDGAVLKFSGPEGHFQLKSDTQEIQFDHTNVSGWYISQISFDVTEQELEKISQGAFERVQLVWKKRSLTFDIAFVPSDEEE